MTSSVMPQRQRSVLIMGPRGSGKTSIIDVMFKKTNAAATLYIESTRMPYMTSFSSFVEFQLWDFPGNQVDPQVFDIPVSTVASVIYVLDGQSVQSDSSDLSHKLALSISRIQSQNPQIYFDLFIHKTEAMSPDYRIELLEDVRQRVLDDLADLEDFGQTTSLAANVFFHLTSIFTPSVYEALSRVINRLIPCQAALERLIDSLCQQSGLEKAFIFHIPSKLWVSTDSSPVDAQTHEICSDFVDLIVDFGGLYCPDHPTNAMSNPSSRSSSVSRSVTPMPNESSSSKDNFSSLINNSSFHTNSTNTNNTPARTTAKTKLSNGTTIAYWEIAEHLGLVALVRPQVLEHQSAMLEYNVSCFCDGVMQVYDIETRPSSSSCNASTILQSPNPSFT